MKLRNFRGSKKIFPEFIGGKMRGQKPFHPFYFTLSMLFFRLPLILFISLFFISCNRYKAYKSQYQFQSESGFPDYSDMNYWAAHPFKWDPSDSIPGFLSKESRDTSVDVFFLHPTTLTRKTGRKDQNARIDDWFINARTDYSSILYQASVFNASCRVFAPRYRQAHIRNFFKKDTVAARKAFDIAYEDIKKAFEYYLAHENKGRPIIIAAHSQGSLLAEILLKDFFENKPLYSKLVVAYIVGWPVPKNYFSSLTMCNDSMQTGCLCSWRTVRKGFVPRYLRQKNIDSYVSNPITWVTTEEYASRDLHHGSVLLDFNKLYTHTTDAKIGNGLLNISRPKFKGSLLYRTRNYHVGDINIFYMDIRENIRQRIAAFWKK